MVNIHSPLEGNKNDTVIDLFQESNLRRFETTASSVCKGSTLRLIRIASSISFQISLCLCSFMLSWQRQIRQLIHCFLNLRAAIFGDQKIKGFREKGEGSIGIKSYCEQPPQLSAVQQNSAV